MEELKELIDLISKLPELAIWVLVAFWCYKIIVIGSIFGIIKLFIVKLHSWLTNEKIVKQVWTMEDLRLTAYGKSLLADFLQKELGEFAATSKVTDFIATYNKGKTNEKS